MFHKDKANKLSKVIEKAYVRRHLLLQRSVHCQSDDLYSDSDPEVEWLKSKNKKMDLTSSTSFAPKEKSSFLST